jgi:hypothetical protein
MVLRELKKVYQEHDNGCFIACTAMLLGTSYNEAFKLIHPDKDPFNVELWSSSIGMTPEASIKRLVRLGLNPSPRPLRQLRNLRKTALILIRWACAPTLMHGIVYDVVRDKFLDPCGRTLKTRVYEKQLDSVYYFNVPQLPFNPHGQSEKAC